MTALQAAGSNADGYNCYASRRYLQRVLFARQKLPTPLSRVSELTKYYCLLHLTRNGNGRAIRRIRRTTDAHESERITVVILPTGRRDGQIGVQIQVGENIISKTVQRLWGTKRQILRPRCIGGVRVQSSEYSDRSITFITQPHLALRLRMSGATPPLPLCGSMAKFHLVFKDSFRTAQ